MSNHTGIRGTGMALDSVMSLILIGFGAGLVILAVTNGGIWLLLIIVGLLLLGIGGAGLVLAWRNRI